MPNRGPLQRLPAWYIDHVRKRLTKQDRSLMTRFLRWLTSRLAPPRIIYDRNGVSPYLSRWYLIGAPTMPDGSHPYESNGAPREGAVWKNKRFGLYIHKFHRGDDEQELHNHPWKWAISLVLTGGYIEERRDKRNAVPIRVILPWRFNFIRSGDFHRVDLLGTEAYTLFLVGPKFKGWGFWNRESGKFWPWREYINALRDPTAFARDNEQYPK
jgi:hypothetical protein